MQPRKGRRDVESDPDKPVESGWLGGCRRRIVDRERPPRQTIRHWQELEDANVGPDDE